MLLSLPRQTTWQLAEEIPRADGGERKTSNDVMLIELSEVWHDSDRRSNDLTTV